MAFGPAVIGQLLSVSLPGKLLPSSRLGSSSCGYNLLWAAVRRSFVNVYHCNHHNTAETPAHSPI
jgi:hypothetical protein